MFNSNLRATGNVALIRGLPGCGRLPLCLLGHVGVGQPARTKRALQVHRTAKWQSRQTGQAVFVCIPMRNKAKYGTALRAIATLTLSFAVLC
jgi:hypothetical protein